MDSGLATSSRPGMTRWDMRKANSGLRVRALHARPGMTDEIRNPPPSIRLRQAEHLLGDEAQDQLRADRGDARDEGLAQVTLDMEFLGVAEAAMGHHPLLAGVEAGFGGEVFR